MKQQILDRKELENLCVAVYSKEVSDPHELKLKKSHSVFNLRKKGYKIIVLRAVNNRYIVEK